jgi:hypothetical protein
VACRRNNVTADAAGRIGIFPLDLPELPTRANKPNGYLLGSYRIATARAELQPAHEPQVERRR